MLVVINIVKRFCENILNFNKQWFKKVGLNITFIYKKKYLLDKKIIIKNQINSSCTK